MNEFTAHPPAMGSTFASRWTPAWQNHPGRSYALMVVGVLGFSAVLGVLWIGLGGLLADQPRSVQAVVGEGVRYGLVALLFAGVGIFYWRNKNTKMSVTATPDGLTISTRTGEAYPFHGAALGTWGVTGGMTMGAALHLRNGSRDLVIGGRDRRITAGTRLDAPDVGYGLPRDIDAWVSADDFDRILAIAGPRRGLVMRAPVPGGPTRLVLFTNPLLVQRKSLAEANVPRLNVDLSPDALRVIDAASHAVLAEARRADVAATPVTYRPTRRHLLLPGIGGDAALGHAMSDAVANHFSQMPGMHLALPGAAPLTVGCRDSDTGMDFRFSWSDAVPTRNAYADYVVSGADWRALVEAFGLTVAES
jgi:hypothetical protein